MKWLGPILLISVFLRHNAAWSLPGYSPQAWFYILGGLLEVLLCSVVLRTVSLPLVSAAMWIGILEGAQVTACRLLTSDITKVKGNLCDALTGLPIGATMTALYLVIICLAIGKSWRSASRS